MDTTDPNIWFDEAGVCGFCHYCDEHTHPVLERAKSEEGKQRFHQIVETIKQAGKSRPYDSILGLSGGTDSSYLAYLAVESGLRPLAVHVDTGWDSEVSEQNIKQLVSKLGLDLEILVIKSEEMRDLQEHLENLHDQKVLHINDYSKIMSDEYLDIGHSLKNADIYSESLVKTRSVCSYLNISLDKGLQGVDSKRLNKELSKANLGN